MLQCSVRVNASAKACKCFVPSFFNVFRSPRFRVMEPLIVPRKSCCCKASGVKAIKVSRYANAHAHMHSSLVSSIYFSRQNARYQEYAVRPFSSVPHVFLHKADLQSGRLLRIVQNVRIHICVNGGLKHVNTPDSYLRERCVKRAASVLSVA